jgi:hypothetical protein
VLLIRREEIEYKAHWSFVPYGGVGERVGEDQMRMHRIRRLDEQATPRRSTYPQRTAKLVARPLPRLLNSTTLKAGSRIDG